MTQHDILLGNACSLLAMVSDSVSGTRKKRSSILAIQIVSQAFYGASTIFLKAYSSSAQNAVAILRNIAALKDVKSRAVEWALILLGVVLGAYFNNRGLLGWLPIIANFEYSVAVFRFKDNTRRLKYAFLVNVVLFLVFSIVIMNYAAALGNVVVGVATAASLVREKK